MFEPIKTKKIYAEIVDQIQKLINEGALKSGDKLIPERELADKLKVSRSSIREAYSALGTMGIIKSKQGEGTFICSSTSEDIIKPLSFILMMDRKSDFDIMEVRKILEAECAYLAAERATEENLLKMKAYIEVMKEDMLKNRIGEESDVNFHIAIAESTQNIIMVRLMNTISDLIKHSMKKSRERIYLKLHNDKKLLRQHEAIFHAISECNSELARKRMHQHLEFVSNEILYMESNPPCNQTIEK